MHSVEDVTLNDRDLLPVVEDLDVVHLNLTLNRKKKVRFLCQKRTYLELLNPMLILLFLAYSIIRSYPICRASTSGLASAATQMIIG